MSLEQAILTHAAALTRLADALTHGRLAEHNRADVADVADVADTVEQEPIKPVAPKAAKPTPAPAPAKAAQEPPKPEPEPVKGALTYDDLKRPFVDIAKKHGVTAALARLAQFGNPKALHELEHKPDVWGQAFAALEE